MVRLEGEYWEQCPRYQWSSNSPNNKCLIWNDAKQNNKKNVRKCVFCVYETAKAHSSSITSPLVAPRGFRDLVAVRTMVNCSKLHDQIDSVRKTKIGSSAIFLSLNESKNSMISAAVPNDMKRNLKKKNLSFLVSILLCEAPMNFLFHNQPFNFLFRVL